MTTPVHTKALAISRLPLSPPMVLDTPIILSLPSPPSPFCHHLVVAMTHHSAPHVPSPPYPSLFHTLTLFPRTRSISSSPALKLVHSSCTCAVTSCTCASYTPLQGLHIFAPTSLPLNGKNTSTINCATYMHICAVYNRPIDILAWAYGGLYSKQRL